MNYLRIGVGVLIVVMAAVGWGQYRQIGLQRELISRQDEAIQSTLESLNAVKGLAETSRDQMADLLTAQGQVQSSLSARQQEIRRLQSDVKEIRAWAEQPLPADIVRMRQRPAARGAGDYGKPMPPSGSVRDAGSGTQDQRRPEPGAGTD